MNCNTTHYRANSSSVPGDPTGKALALRTGYNFGADDLNFSAGLGLYTTIGSTHAEVDYAYTHAEFLEAVHRVTLGMRF